MKKIILIFCFFLIISSSVTSQWFPQNSGTTDNILNVQFVNDLVGWVTTDQLIYKTTDGGQNWQFQYTQYPIFQILFSSENVGWMVSWFNYDPELLKTTNGGENWAQVYSGGEWISNIDFINPDTGWIVGAVQLGYLFKATTDGGTTWVDKTVSPNYSEPLEDILAIDNMNLIVFGYEILFITTNGGNSWQEIPIFWSDQYKPQFFNMNLGWINPYNYDALFKTTNGGNTWQQQVQPVDDYQFITPLIGWYTYNNQIYHSTNGGSSWTLQNSNTNNSLYDIFFLNSNYGWAVGQNGTILHTINGGVPVELVNFTLEIINNNITLNWTTATETNNQGFEILRKAQNDNEWIKIGFTEGYGTSTEPQFYSFTDQLLQPGKYQYRLKQIDFDGGFEYSNILEVTIESPKEFSLLQNYPNPFNPTTSLQYTVGSRQFVSLKVYDVLGNEVATLVNEEKPAGEYEVDFDGSELPSGIYFYQLKAGNFVDTKKMILLK